MKSSPLSSVRVAACAAVLLGVLPTAAGASQLIDRNASHVTLAVSSNGQALIGYRAHGRERHVLAYGAVNAASVGQRKRQVAFTVRYYTGPQHAPARGRVRPEPATSSALPLVTNACGRYRGGALHWLVRACTMPDGSHWALQSWRRMLPNFGLNPIGLAGEWELRLSHWTGAAPVLVVKRDWAYGRFDHLYGWATFHNAGVFGLNFDRYSAPTDTWGRELFIDTLDSGYGSGWERENSFPTRDPNGAFCYGFYPHGHSSTGTGRGRAYRATLEGPGVAPDPFWQGAALGAFNPALDDVANAEQVKLTAGRSYCHVG